MKTKTDVIRSPNRVISGPTNGTHVLQINFLKNYDYAATVQFNSSLPGKKITKKVSIVTVYYENGGENDTLRNSL